MSKCPSVEDDEVARQWTAGSLSPPTAVAFEAHLRTCSRCQKAVERAAGVTAALRTAAASHTTPGPMQRFASAVATQARALADTIRQSRPR